jgi:hypothetical protein
MLDAGDCRSEVLVKRNERQADGRGGFTSAPRDIGTFWVALHDAGAREVREGERLSERIDRVLFAPAGTDIRQGDRVTELATNEILRVVSARKRNEEGAGFVLALLTATTGETKP